MIKLGHVCRKKVMNVNSLEASSLHRTKLSACAAQKNVRVDQNIQLRTWWFASNIEDTTTVSAKSTF